MDTITRTAEVRGGDIADFHMLAPRALHVYDNGMLLQLGRNKRGLLAYFDERGLHRLCTGGERELIHRALDAALEARYVLVHVPGPSGNVLCQWERVEPEVYDHPVAHTALLLGWITR